MILCTVSTETKMVKYNKSNMITLIKDFSLEHIKQNGKLWISVESFRDRVIIDPKFNCLIDDHQEDDEDFIYDATTEYVRAEKCFEIAKKLNSHPEHYNVHQRFELEVKFRKTDEI